MNWIPLMVPTEDYAELSGIVLQRTLDRQRAAGETGTEAPNLHAAMQAAPLGDYRFPMQLNPAAASLRELNPATDWTAKAVEYAQRKLNEHQAWDVETLEKFATSEYLTVQRWHVAMDLCATHPNTYFSTTQVVAETELELNEWRDAPRKITAHLAKHYPEVGGTWPLIAASGRGLGVYDEVYWSMPYDVAVTWAQIRGLDVPAIDS